MNKSQGPLNISETDETEVENLLFDLIKIESHQDTPGYEKNLADFIVNYLKKKGIDTKCQEVLGETYFFGGDLVFYEGWVATQFIYDCDVFKIGNSLKKFADKNIDVLFPGHGTFVLKYAQNHINRSLDYFEKSVIPPSIIY